MGRKHSCITGEKCGFLYETNGSAPESKARSLGQSDDHIHEKNGPVFRLNKIKGSVERIQIRKFYVVSYKISAGQNYWKTVTIARLFVEGTEGAYEFHILDCSSTKKRRVRHSSYGTEILGSAEFDDCGFYFKK